MESEGPDQTAQMCRRDLPYLHWKEIRDVEIFNRAPVWIIEIEEKFDVLGPVVQS